MDYIVRNGNVFEKYKVEFDKEKLEELFYKVIECCGEKHHEKRVCTLRHIPKSNRYICIPNVKGEGIYYKNIKAQKTGKKTIEYYEYKPFEEDLYNYEYMKYIVPSFASYIIKIINGDVDAISQLFVKNKDAFDNFLTVEEKIDNIYSLLKEKQGYYLENQRVKIEELNTRYSEHNIGSSPTPDQYKTVSSLLKELKKLEKGTKQEIDKLNEELSDLLRIRELNKDQEHIDKYYLELLDLVKFTIIDTLEVSNIDRVNEFWGKKSETRLNLVLKK